MSNRESINLVRKTIVIYMIIFLFLSLMMSGTAVSEVKHTQNQTNSINFCAITTNSGIFKGGTKIIDLSIRDNCLVIVTNNIISDYIFNNNDNKNHKASFNQTFKDLVIINKLISPSHLVNFTESNKSSTFPNAKTVSHNEKSWLNINTQNINKQISLSMVFIRQNPSIITLTTGILLIFIGIIGIILYTNQDM